MLNSICLVGRLCNTPELKITNTDIPVTSFTLAVGRKYKQNGETQTDFINILAWRKNAEFCCRYLKKGEFAAIEGSVQMHSYTDKEGNKRKSFDVVADSVRFVGTKKSNQQSDNYNDPAICEMSNDSFKELDLSDSDLPF